MPRIVMDDLRQFILSKGANPIPYRVYITGYYHHWMEGRGYKIDASDVGRPFPAQWEPHGYFMELFGLSIHIDIAGSSDLPSGSDLGGDTDKTKILLTSVVNGTPTFDHVLNVLLRGGAKMSDAKFGEPKSE
ncbi:hypothetical protein HFN99_01015 [Rhizobium laguerreae]|uniref:hypothetical protein n=1 Tax=Rhizobium laguerreae TaxID=1076926 RepID=UPI001C90C161|nr:hypothetical protein [Rhizobium laguerreae]MBY3335513.1 hypothetical protein [Rhizobium laguerreae]